MKRGVEHLTCMRCCYYEPSLPLSIVTSIPISVFLPLLVHGHTSILLFELLFSIRGGVLLVIGVRIRVGVGGVYGNTPIFGVHPCVVLAP